MIDYINLAKFDPQNMHKIYDKWPDTAQEHYKKNHDFVEYKDIKHIVLAGGADQELLAICINRYYLKITSMSVL